MDLTQTDSARLVACLLATIKKIEADERRPSRDMAERLADYGGRSRHQHHKKETA